MMAKLGLTLNEAKTSVKDARTASFDFLGYSLGPRHYPDSGRRYLGASPSRKSVQRIKAKISGMLTPGNKGALPDVRNDRIRLSDWLHRRAHGGGIWRTRRRRSTPSSAYTYSRENRFVPRPGSLCRLQRKLRTRS